MAAMSKSDTRKQLLGARRRVDSMLDKIIKARQRASSATAKARNLSLDLKALEDRLERLTTEERKLAQHWRSR